MEGNLLIYIIIGAIVLFIIYSMMKNQNDAGINPSDRDYRNRGTERPRFDDPDIRGHGSFGNRASDDRDNNDNMEWLRNRSSNANYGGSNYRKPTTDSKEVEGRGSFGRDKG